MGTVAFVKDSPARAKGGLDVPGAALLTATMVALLLGFSEGPTWGWGSAVLPTVAAFTTGFLVCGACALVALGLCVPLARARAVAVVPESAGAVAD